MPSNAESALTVFEKAIGGEEGPTDWHEITQDQVNQFADATLDHQIIHVDPERAAQTPFGGPVAHGFLTLSLTAGLSMGMKGDPAAAKGMIRIGSSAANHPVAIRSHLNFRRSVT